MTHPMHRVRHPICVDQRMFPREVRALWQVTLSRGKVVNELVNCARLIITLGAETRYQSGYALQMLQFLADKVATLQDAAFS